MHHKQGLLAIWFDMICIHTLIAEQAQKFWRCSPSDVRRSPHHLRGGSGWNLVVAEKQKKLVAAIALVVAGVVRAIFDDDDDDDDDGLGGDGDIHQAWHIPEIV